MKVVIVCGGDRTGKSSICREFIENGYEYYHFDPPKKSPYQEYKEFVDNVLKNPENKNKKFIIDRYMYCEFPYSKHYKRNTDMTIEKMQLIESEILQLDNFATIIYCENDIDDNLRLLNIEGKKEFKSKQEVLALRTNYKLALNKSLLHILTYNFSIGDTPKQIFRNITNG